MKKKNLKVSLESKSREDSFDIAMKLGICQNCENLKMCKFRKDIPVWYCEEYY